MLEQNISMIQMHLLSVQILWMIFMIILMITTQAEKRTVLIVFYDMIADIMTNKKFQAITKELFIRCRKLNTSLAFITQSYFFVLEDVRLNSTHYLIMKTNNRKELQNIAINHSSDIDYNDLVRICRQCTRKPYSFLIIDTTLPASDTLRFGKNLLPFYKNDSRGTNQVFRQKNYAK